MNDLKKSEAHDGASPKLARQARAVVMSAAVGVLLGACGGGGSGSGNLDTQLAGASGRSTVQSAKQATAGTATHADAFRLLTQASFGPTDADVAHVMSIGASAWIDEQFALPVRAHNLARWNSDNAITGQGMPNTVTSSFYEEAMEDDDQLRQRVAFALSEIFVVSMQDISLGSTKSQMVASYLDMLNKDAFGNYRTLLNDVAMHPAMGVFLSSMSNRKEDPRVGRIPDQNFAREVMQLFSIGLVQLNIDGTPKLDSNNQPVYTYGPADIDGLSRVFTGFAWAGPDTSQDRFNNNPSVQVPLRAWTPMQGYPQDHSLSAKTFLGTTVAAQTTANPSLSLNTALDTIAGHANVGPFISKQLIQRLVTSNPSPGYVTRVAKVFNDNGSGVRGDMKAVIRAVLIDSEARNDTQAASSTSFGKLREPVLRLVQWARAFGVRSPTQLWPFGNTSSSANRLAESPGRSGSVFNWFRPGYAPPGTAIATAGRVAPEFQITNEPSLIAYVNFMQQVIGNGAGEAKPDYSALTAIAADSQALLDQLNLVLAAQQLSAATIAQMKTALDTIRANTDAGLASRVNAAILLVMASPEYLVLR